MRIRKRQAPLPLSSLSPVPISSDPNSSGGCSLSLVVQLHQHGLDPHQNLSRPADGSCSQPSDRSNQPIGTGILSYSNTLLDHQKNLEDEDEDGKKSNDSSTSSILGEELAAAGVLSQLSSSQQGNNNVVVGTWPGGEKAFPLKKRVRRETSNDGDDDAQRDYKKKKKKRNKKFDEDEDEGKGLTREILDSINDSKRLPSSSSSRGRGSGATMDGSRCSRVNGRGWRCCQQTLVGYSLCEHHLGKGRLRSMNNVRSRSHNLGSSAKPARTSTAATAIVDHGDKQLGLSSEVVKQELMGSEADDQDDDDGDGEKPLVIGSKKRMKLGMVKARSISSLLGQKDDNDQIHMASRSSSDHHHHHHHHHHKYI